MNNGNNSCSSKSTVITIILPKSNNVWGKKESKNNIILTSFRLPTKNKWISSANLWFECASNDSFRFVVGSVAAIAIILLQFMLFLLLFVFPMQIGCQIHETYKYINIFLIYIFCGRTRADDWQTFFFSNFVQKYQLHYNDVYFKCAWWFPFKPSISNCFLFFRSVSII